MESSELATDAIEPKPLVQTLLDASPDAAILLDAKGKILVANEAFAECLGKSQEDIVDESAWDASVAGELLARQERVAREAIRSGLGVDAEDRYDGRIFRIRCFPVHDKRGRPEGTILFFRDITVEKRAREALAKKDAALAELLNAGDRVKKELAEAVMANVEKLILPLIEDLRRHLDDRDRKLLDQLAESLKQITSPFVACVSHKLTNLTLNEIRICELLRRGLSTAEIADRRHISPATVRKHRENIRRKLGLQGQNTSLVQYLDTLARHIADQSPAEYKRL